MFSGTGFARYPYKILRYRQQSIEGIMRSLLQMTSFRHISHNQDATCYVSFDITHRSATGAKQHFAPIERAEHHVHRVCALEYFTAQDAVQWPLRLGKKPALFVAHQRLRCALAHGTREKVQLDIEREKFTRSLICLEETPFGVIDEHTVSHSFNSCFKLAGTGYCFTRESLGYSLQAPSFCDIARDHDATGNIPFCATQRSAAHTKL